MRKNEQFAYLDARSWFSPGGVSDPEKYVLASHVLNTPIGISDVETTEGWSFVDMAAKRYSAAPVFGIELKVQDNKSNSSNRVTSLVAEREGFDSVANILEANLPITSEMLSKNSEGIIFIAPLQTYKMLVEHIPQDMLFLEIQPPDDNNRLLTDATYSYSEKVGANLVASTRPWMAELRDRSLAVSIVKSENDYKRTGASGLSKVPVSAISNNEKLFAYLQSNNLRLPQYLQAEDYRGYIAPGLITRNRFRSLSSACDATLEIYRRIGVNSLPLPSLPEYLLPDGMTASELLQKRCESFLSIRFPIVTQEVRDRLKHELSVISNKNYDSIMLIMSDVVSIARHMNIDTVACGSCTGSLVCYVLGISDIDPLKEGLSFDRFLTEQTKKTPDLDIQVPTSKRQYFLNSIKRRFYDNGIYLHQISVFPKWGGKEALKAVAKSFDVPDSVVNEVVQRSLVVQNLSDQRIGHSVSHPTKSIIVNTSRVVGFEQGKKNHIPMHKSDAERVANIDILSSHSLDLLNTLKNLNLVGESTLSNQQEVLDMIMRGDVSGVPYLDTVWVKKIIKKFSENSEGPYSPNDLCNLIALTRPAARPIISVYFDRRGRNSKIPSMSKEAWSVLKDTYGLILYQEQVLDIASRVGGFNVEESDLLRQAISKNRSTKAFNLLESRFFSFSKKLGIPQSESLALMQAMRRFVSYGFIRGHLLNQIHKIILPIAWYKYSFPEIFNKKLSTQQRKY